MITPIIKLNPKLDTIDTINQIIVKSEGVTSIKSGISGQSGKVCKNENELKGVIEICPLTRESGANRLSERFLPSVMGCSTLILRYMLVF